MSAQGHRTVPHTADLRIEAWATAAVDLRPPYCGPHGLAVRALRP